MHPHRLAPAAGSLEAGITGFFPIQAFNSVILSGFFHFVKGLPHFSGIFPLRSPLLHGPQQFFGGYAEEFGQGQQVGGGGIGGAVLP